MDFTTLTILAILSFILAWFGIMIFTTAPKDEEKAGEQESQPQVVAALQPQVPVASMQPLPQPAITPPHITAPPITPSIPVTVQAPPIPENPVAKVAKIADDGLQREDEVTMYRELVDKYSSMVLQLKKKIEVLENTTGYAGVSNDKLIDWISELRRENKYLKAQMADHEEENMDDYQPDDTVSEVQSQSPLRAENKQLRKKLDDHTQRVTELQQEIDEMKSGLHYYRDIVNKLQGSYTVINRYNYRTCIRDPNTGEFHYELVKLPPDFDPFNPTYITKEGMEIFENYGIKIPTKLGDIVREEFRKGPEYWEEDAGVDWKLGR
jgi:hypothetical protein